MGDTSIQWTDKTWNPVTGCTKVSPGCAHCYAEGIAKRLWPTSYPPIVDGAGAAVTGEALGRPREFTDVQTHEDRLLEPLSWRKPSKVFVNSMSDLFHEDVPQEFIDRVMLTITRAVYHTFQVLTKRPERMRRYFSEPGLRDRIDRLGLINNPTIGKRGKIPPTLIRQWPLPTLWLGVSVENQKLSDERIPLLLQTPAAVRFISAEPLLESIDVQPFLRWKFDTFPQHIDRHGYADKQPSRLDWVIVGGESGPGARPFDLAWARSIVQQCKAAGVPVFVKQLGAKPSHGLSVVRNGHRFLNLKDRKGGDMAEWPEDLRVRQSPEPTVPRSTSETSRV